MTLSVRVVQCSLVLLSGCVLPLKAQENRTLGYDPLMVTNGTESKRIDLTVNDEDRKREVPLRVYLPMKETPSPVILFSHGLGGSREGNVFMGNHWSARGYVAVFLQHPGSDNSVWKDKPFDLRAKAMFDAVAPLSAARNLILRVQDVTATLDQLEKWNKTNDHVLAGRVDSSKIGMSGHSFGAKTTQAVSGEKFQIGKPMTDHRIKAATIFSPGKPARGDIKVAFGDVKIPWLLMTGTKDVAQLGGKTLGDQSFESRLEVYPALPPDDKYELVLFEANHFAFTDRPDFGSDEKRNPNHHRVILALTTAFLDAYLMSDEKANAWLQSDAPRAMEANDSWKKK